SPQLARSDTKTVFTSAPSSEPVKSQLRLPITWRRSCRSLQLLCIGSRPSSRKRSKASRWLVAYPSAFASGVSSRAVDDLDERHGGRGRLARRDGRRLAEPPAPVGQRARVTVLATGERRGVEPALVPTSHPGGPDRSRLACHR